MVNVRKRGNFYQYQFEVAPINGKRKQVTKSGFKTKAEAEKAGITNSVASCTLMIELGKQVHFSMGSEKNIKITTVDDVDIFKALLLAKRSEWLK